MTDNRSVWIGVLLGGVSVFALCPATASAAASPATTAQPSQLEEVVVTAERRAENQQDVPITVSAFTAATLVKSGVTSTDELLAITPGLVMTRQLRGSTPFIRGVGSSSSSPGNEAPVAQYVDGVYFMSTIGNVFSFNNVERVEVLKGPQGTLFGRNATGGLINVITRDPSKTPGFDGSATYGNYNTWTTALYGSTGIGPVAADLALYAIKQGDGFGHNLNTGQDVNRQDELAIRSKLVWAPTDGDRFTFSSDWSTNKTDMGLVRNAVSGSLLIGKTPFRGGPFDFQGGFPSAVNDFHAWGASLKYQRDFAWGSFQSLTAYRHQQSQSFLDQDATPLRVVDVTINEENSWAQQELLLLGKAKRLDWTTGVFLFTGTSQYRPLAIGSSLIPSQNIQSFAREETHSYAVFAEGTYELTDATRATAGLRYTSDERTFDGHNVAAAGNPAAVGTVVASASGSKRFPKVTWHFALDQKLAENVMVYASYSRGFKSGVFNTGSITAPPVRPETLDAAEIGLKSEFLEHRLRINVAAFHYEYKDMQLSRVINGGAVIFNAAAGKMDGVDFETILAPPVPIGALQLTAGGSWLNAKYSSFPSGPVSVPSAAGGNATVAGDLTGFRMVRSPKWTTTVGLDYSLPMGPGTLDASANYYYNSGFFWEPDNRLKQAPYHLINAQLAYDFGPDHRYRVRVFGKNLTNTIYGSYVSAGALGDEAAMAPPKTYGVGLDVHF